jgi:two-component system, chemotaxis family, chemotaxis protein CheY
MRALVVEDSRAMRTILTRILQGLGAEVAPVEDAAKALEYFASHQVPDLALVDWHLPGMNGLELVSTLRADDRFAPMSIMMVTTECELDEISAALTAGANEYLIKPFTQEAVAEKLNLMGMGGEDDPAATEVRAR